MDCTSSNRIADLERQVSELNDVVAHLKQKQSETDLVVASQKKKIAVLSGRGGILRSLPDHVLTTQVFSFFGFKDYALTSCASNYLQAHWQHANELTPLPLYVPEDCRTLNEAVTRVAQDQRITTIVLGKGEHHIGGVYLKISSAVNIVGDPGMAKEEIVVVGGISFQEGIQGNCHLQHMTLRQAKKFGVWGASSFTMEDVLVEQCGYHGVQASGTGVVGQCTNVEVRHCGWSGVIVFGGATITLIGDKTTVHHNCKHGDSGHYGLIVSGSSSSTSSSSTIQMVSPLTKEQVSKHNGGGRNWGTGYQGDINQIKTIDASSVAFSVAFSRDVLRLLPDHVLTTQVITYFTFKDYALARCACNYLQMHWHTTNQNKPLPLYVPEDCKTLKEAVKRVKQDPRITTIVLGEGEHQIGEHQIDGHYLKISSPMNIVGNPKVPKESIVVLGGIYLDGTDVEMNSLLRLVGIDEVFKLGGSHLQHMTIRQARWEGVYGKSSFTMEDILVEQCGSTGVGAYGPGVVGRCTNVEVRQCGLSGVRAGNGASITLIGAKTMVHHNCTRGGSDEYSYGLV